MLNIVHHPCIFQHNVSEPRSVIVIMCKRGEAPIYFTKLRPIETASLPTLGTEARFKRSIYSVNVVISVRSKNRKLLWGYSC
jgi:hypothetical protein